MQTEYPDLHDVTNRFIRVGDVIVYPVRRGSKMVLKIATVCEVPGKGCVVKKGIVALNRNGRRVIISDTSRCAVVGRYNDFNFKGERSGDL